MILSAVKQVTCDTVCNQTGNMWYCLQSNRQHVILSAIKQATCDTVCNQTGDMWYCLQWNRRYVILSAIKQVTCDTVCSQIQVTWHEKCWYEILILVEHAVLMESYNGDLLQYSCCLVNNILCAGIFFSLFTFLSVAWIFKWLTIDVPIGIFINSLFVGKSAIVNTNANGLS